MCIYIRSYIRSARCDGIVKLVAYEHDESAMYVATERFAASLAEVTSGVLQCVAVCCSVL